MLIPIVPQPEEGIWASSYHLDQFGVWFGKHVPIDWGPSGIAIAQSNTFIPSPVQFHDVQKDFEKIRIKKVGTMYFWDIEED